MFVLCRYPTGVAPRTQPRLGVVFFRCRFFGTRELLTRVAGRGEGRGGRAMPVRDVGMLDCTRRSADACRYSSAWPFEQKKTFFISI